MAPEPLWSSRSSRLLRSLQNNEQNGQRNWLKCLQTLLKPLWFLLNEGLGTYFQLPAQVRLWFLWEPDVMSPVVTECRHSPFLQHVLQVLVRLPGAWWAQMSFWSLLIQFLLWSGTGHDQRWPHNTAAVEQDQMLAWPGCAPSRMAPVSHV